MLYIYIASLLFGGLFVGLSVLSGLGDSGIDLDKEIDFDNDLDLDHELELDLDHELELDLDHDMDGGVGAADIEIHRHRKKYTPYLSFKFYTFISAFFGLTGVVLTLLQMGTLTSLVASIIMGAIAGFGITLSLHLADSSVAGQVSAQSYRGSSATVVLPLKNGETGKVKFRYKGQLVEMRALPYDAEDEVVLDFGESCFVIDVKDGIAQVIHAEKLGKHST